MSFQHAQFDGNHVPALIGHSDTTSQAETRKVVVTDGNLHVMSLSAIVPGSYDYIDISYPDGTTEVYDYKNGGVAGTTISTVTVVYSDATKGSITSVAKT